MCFEGMGAGERWGFQGMVLALVCEMCFVGAVQRGFCWQGEMCFEGMGAVEKGV